MKLYIHARSNWGDGNEDYGYDISEKYSHSPVREKGNSHTFIVREYCTSCKGTGVIPPSPDGDEDRHLSDICQKCDGDTTLEIERLSSLELARKYGKWFQVPKSQWSGSV